MKEAVYFKPQSHNFVILYSRISPLPVCRVMYFKLTQSLRPEGFFRDKITPILGSNAVGKFTVWVVVSRFFAQ